MAAVQTVINTPIRDTSESSANLMRKVLAPVVPHSGWYRIVSASNFSIERANVTDGAARGANYENYVATTVHYVRIRRGEFGISSAGTSVAIEITPLSARPL